MGGTSANEGAIVNKEGIILLVLLFIQSPVCADSVTSSITCNGASFVSSSVMQPDRSWSESLFAVDSAMILRDILARDSVNTHTRIISQGPVGIFEYSGANESRTADPPGCLLGNRDNRTESRYTTTVLGLMEQGMYASTLSQRTTSEFLLMANGTGILLTRAAGNDGTRVLSHASDAFGDLNMTERMEFGDDNGI
ncbi:MAG TPA: hypothetical protein PK024_12060 [Methanospirillum sp.]|uniref:hypothetical protein n=1 Tax=Methanospirillum sp. TaxID=45200 RepID=UPI002C0E12E4|nr:hypothetical protein [Methanospirillum sp.]HOJ97557.1 hypothetical protein [Methanospirillum sp.]HOL41953.1 hypothetical protein [Methanospirillum sp.]HPP78101.1 hypothetical protein [Methanospirillum sp.]